MSPPNSYVKTLTPNVITLRDGALKNGLSALKCRDTEPAPTLPLAIQ